MTFYRSIINETALAGYLSPSFEKSKKITEKNYLYVISLMNGKQKTFHCSTSKRSLSRLILLEKLRP